MRSHTKFGPDRFSLLYVYWIQTNRQTDKLNLYIEARRAQNYKRNISRLMQHFYRKGKTPELKVLASLICLSNAVEETGLQQKKVFNTTTTKLTR